MLLIIKHSETLTAVEDHCSSKVTANNVLAELKTLKQGDNMADFCKKFEKITDQLKSAYLRENIPNQTADKMCTKSGIETLIRCARNNEVKAILKAGSFNSISNAIQKFQEHETTTASTTSSQIYFSSSSRNSPQRGRGNFRGNRGRGSFNTRRFENFPRDNFNYTRFQRGSWNHRLNGNTRGNWVQRGHFRPNMFVAQQNTQPLYQQPWQQAQYKMQNQQVPHLQHQQQQLQHQQNPCQNVHPSGVQFGQHTQ